MCYWLSTLCGKGASSNATIREHAYTTEKPILWSYTTRQASSRAVRCYTYRPPSLDQLICKLGTHHTYNVKGQYIFFHFAFFHNTYFAGFF